MSEALDVGSRIGQYQLARQIGQGGMGVVYEAIHAEIGRHAAVKVLSARCADDPHSLGRFLNEARAISRVRHPGLVQIYDFGQTASGAPYILMELLDGETLRARIDRRRAAGERLAVEEARRLVRQIAAVLAETHEQAIVHRDLKPENVMLVDDEDVAGGERVKLLDFGIARFVGSQDTALTAPGTAIGTVAYMSPEQCAGDVDVSGAADVYALGVMLYELLGGARPFEAATAVAVMRMHLAAEPPPLAASSSSEGAPPPSSSGAAAPPLPPELVQLVARMLAKEPTRRPSMREVVEALAGAPERAAAAAVVRPRGGDATEELRRPAVGTAPVGAEEGTAATVPARGAAAPSASASPSSPGAAPPAAALDPAASSLAPLPAPSVASPASASSGSPSGSSPSAPAAAPTRRRMPGAVGIVSAVVAALLLISSVVWLRGGGRQSLDPLDPSPPAQLSNMVWFAGGASRMGRTAEEVELECRRLGAACQRDKLDREQPAHQVMLSPFYLDKWEATNGEVASWLTTLRPSLELRKDEERGLLRWVYLDGLRLVDLLPPDAGIVREADGSFTARPGQAARPMVQITWDGASLYCKGHGKRLPTEAEWERAAGGLVGRRFPWGEAEPTCAGVVWGREEGKPCHALPGSPAPAGTPDASGTPGASAVGTAPGDRTPEGIFDLGGNVMEWVQDQFLAPYYAPCGECIDPVSEAPVPLLEDTRVVRGGSWVQSWHMGRASSRGRWKRVEVLVNAGFRCASH